MCCPRSGAGPWGSLGVRDSFTGLPVVFTGPSTGCATSVTMRRCAICGSDATSAIFCTGPQAICMAENSSIHSCVLLCRRASLKIGSSS